MSLTALSPSAVRCNESAPLDTTVMETLPAMYSVPVTYSDITVTEPVAVPVATEPVLLLSKDADSAAEPDETASATNDAVVTELDVLRDGGGHGGFGGGRGYVGYGYGRGYGGYGYGRGYGGYRYGRGYRGYGSRYGYPYTYPYYGWPYYYGMYWCENQRDISMSNRVWYSHMLRRVWLLVVYVHIDTQAEVIHTDTDRICAKVSTIRCGGRKECAPINHNGVQSRVRPGTLQSSCHSPIK